MARRIFFGAILVVAIIAFTYYSGEEQTVPVTGRTQRVALSDEQQQELGLQVYEETLAAEGEKVITSGRQYEQVRRVAERIARVGLVDKPEFEWDVSLVESPDANAFALPGGKMIVYIGLLGAGAQVGLSLPWGREQESESDHIGLIYMARADYDPTAAITIWQKMAKASGGRQPPEYLSTHPSNKTRVREIRRLLPEAARERRQRDEVA